MALVEIFIDLAVLLLEHEMVLLRYQHPHTVVVTKSDLYIFPNGSIKKQNLSLTHV